MLRLGWRVGACVMVARTTRRGQTVRVASWGFTPTPTSPSPAPRRAYVSYIAREWCMCEVASWWIGAFVIE